MVRTPHGVLVEGRHLVYTFQVVLALFDATDAANRKESEIISLTIRTLIRFLLSPTGPSYDINDARLTKIVNILSKPPTVVELAHVQAGFVVAANNEGQDWCLFLAEVVRMILPHLFVFFWNSHGVQVYFVPDGLEVAAAEDYINYFTSILLPLQHVVVHFVEFAVQAPDYSHVHFFENYLKNRCRK